ncbi:MAG: hypothetical protein Unbinned4118contig1001_23 [Prokaryotic dsDNA virus sp.]|jgi:hypothetical protein|nr:MAG: hypothetical protein Unbinned4118contig1001_23 [Prokaryotic dsDNA virus sp.]|tara:strand:+ start:2548 stop:3129 length:582 start_codon:yes stop_codon:yes gene_type:complete
MADITPSDLAELMRKKSQGDILRSLNRYAIRKAARLEKYAKLNAGRVLNVRSGRLRSSISAKPLADEKGNIILTLQAGGRKKGVSYARIHEEGGEIRPVKGKFLTIPIHKSLFTGSGVQRYASVRDVPDPLAPAQTRKGQMVLVHQMTGEVFYLLRKRVKIDRRPYLKPAVNKVRREIGRELKPLLGAELRHG